MAASTAPAAQAAILALLAPLTATGQPLAGVQVTWGQPTEREDVVAEMVYFDGDVEGRDEWAAMGAGKLQERYTFRLAVASFQHGDGAQAAEERAHALRAAVVAALRANPSLGGVVITSEFGAWSRRSTPYVDGWGVRITFDLSCTAWI